MVEFKQQKQIDVEVGDTVDFIYFDGFSDNHVAVKGPVVHIIPPNVVPSDEEMAKYYQLTPLDEDPAAPRYSYFHRAIPVERLVIPEEDHYVLVPNDTSLHGILTNLSK